MSSPLIASLFKLLSRPETSLGNGQHRACQASYRVACRDDAKTASENRTSNSILRSSLRAAGAGSAKHPGVGALVGPTSTINYGVVERRPHRKLSPILLSNFRRNYCNDAPQLSGSGEGRRCGSCFRERQRVEKFAGRRQVARTPFRSMIARPGSEPPNSQPG